MTEPRLETALTARVDRIVWLSISGFVVLVLVVFGFVAEYAVRSSADDTADVIQSLLGLYADPEGTPTGVAPDMLAGQLLEMGTPFAITRTAQVEDSDVMVYYLSPGMPAKPLEGLSGASAPSEARNLILMSFAERAHWRYRIQHRHVLNEMGDFDIYVVAGRANILYAGAGLSIAAILLLPITALLTRRHARSAIRRTLEPLGRVTEETRNIHPNDLSQRVVTPTGQREITELAGSINRMLDRVEDAQRALKAFTADASHELRTPLTHIKARVQWCLDEERDRNEMAEAFAAIEHEVSRTTRMVDDLLLIARGENNQLELNKREFDLQQTVAEVAEIAHAMASDKDIHIAAECDGPAMAWADMDRTRQIVLNLLTNAVRYTPSGSVTIRCVSDEKGSVGIEVTDTGTGIPEASIRRIFDRFYRVDSSRSRELGGSGLGLTIAKVLAEVQNGRIDVSSRVGEGSRFTLWLPVSRTAAASQRISQRATATAR